jgi:hypothetical protein
MLIDTIGMAVQPSLDAGQQPVFMWNRKRHGPGLIAISDLTGDKVEWSISQHGAMRIPLFAYVPLTPKLYDSDDTAPTLCAELGMFAELGVRLLSAISLQKLMAGRVASIIHVVGMSEGIADDKIRRCFFGAAFLT